MSWEHLSEEKKAKEIRKKHTCEETRKCFDETAAYLLSTNALMGHVLSRLGLTIVGSDGVRGEIIPECPTLRWCYPMCNLTLGARVAVLEHEIMHIIDDHMSRRGEYGCSNAKYQVATDIVCNAQLVENHSEDDYQKKFQELAPYLHTNLKYNLPNDLTIGEYVEMLPEFEEQERDSNFPGLASISASSNQKLTEEVKQVVKEAMAYGKGSQALQNCMMKPKDAEFDLNIYVRQFVNSMMKTRRELTKKVVSKRYGMPPGTRVRHLGVPKLLVGVDVSGSMDTVAVEMFYGALRHISRKVEGIVVQFDDQVFEDTAVTISKAASSDILSRDGCGGTSFIPMMKKAEDEGYHGVILFTDTWGHFPNRFDGDCLVVIPEGLRDSTSCPNWARITEIRGRGTKKKRRREQ
jgi:predicted metal-dependent peptidase